MFQKGVSLTEQSSSTHCDVLGTVVVAGDSDMNEALYVITFIARISVTMPLPRHA